MILIADIAALALLVLGFVYGYKKGFIKSVYSIATLVLTVAIVMLLQDKIVASLSAGEYAKSLRDAIAEQSAGILAIPKNELSAELPEFMSELIDGAAQGSRVIDNFAAYVTTMILKTVVSASLFIVIKLAFALLFPLVSMIFKLPVIKNANSIAGGILSMVNMLFILYVACGILAVFTAGKTDIINDTYLVQFLYHNNIVMRLLT